MVALPTHGYLASAKLATVLWNLTKAHFVYVTYTMTLAETLWHSHK